MSTLQVANLHFESTGNNRIQLAAGNTVAVVAAGANTFVANSTVVNIVAGGANTFVANSTVVNIVAGGVNALTANSTATTITGGILANGSVGTAGLALLSGGAGANAYWGAPGAWKHIATADASSSASIIFTDLNAYQTLRATFVALKPATDNANFEYHVSTNNGVTFDQSGSSYDGSYFARSSGMTTNTIQSGNLDDTITVSTVGIAATDYPLTGEMFISNFNKTGIMSAIVHLSWSSSGSLDVMMTGTTIHHVPVTAARNALRFKFRIGNIASGRIILEGIEG